MRLTQNQKDIDKVLESRIAKGISRGAAALMLPLMAWVGTTLVSIDTRLTRVEQEIRDKLADVYPRSEATQATNYLDAKIDALRDRLDRR
jgi:hypothetical protein